MAVSMDRAELEGEKSHFQIYRNDTMYEVHETEMNPVESQ